MREKLKNYIEGKWALATAGVIGFLENSFLFVMFEPIVIPMMASKPTRPWSIAAMLLLGNIIAAIFVYYLGVFLAETVLQDLLRQFRLERGFARVKDDLEAGGPLALFLVGITPVPFQAGAIAAGVTKMGFAIFLLVVTVSRAMRYFAVAIIVSVIGVKARDFIQRYQFEIFVGGTLLFIGMGLVMWLMHS